MYSEWYIGNCAVDKVSLGPSDEMIFKERAGWSIRGSHANVKGWIMPGLEKSKCGSPRHSQFTQATEFHFWSPPPFFVLQHFSFGQSLISAQLESFLVLPFWPLPLPICPAIQQPVSKKSSRSKDRKKLGETYYGFKSPEHTRRGFLSHLPGAFDRIPDSRLWPQLLSSLHHYEHQGGRDQPRRGKQLSCVWCQILTWKPMA